MGREDAYVSVESPISAPSEGNSVINHGRLIKPELVPHAEALRQAIRTEDRHDAVTDIISSVLPIVGIPKHVGTELVKTALNLFNIFAG